MEPIKKIVIVGGGTSGWIAASVLSNQFRPDVLEVELVESEDIGTIGVGESTIPPFVGLIRNLGIDEQHFIQKVHATFKLGIRFPEWSNLGESYFHPFGSIGVRFGIYEFYQAWLKAKSMGHDSGLQEFAPCSVMADKHKFFLPQEAQKTPIGGASYAMHIDARLAADYLRGYAENRGVTRTEGMVTEVTQKEDGSIASLRLKSGKEVHGDFFIDCTGFFSLLIEKTLGVGFEDWSRFLPCDKAVAVQTENTGEALPYTISTAREAGWTWRIPLQHRTGNGYVYSSEHCSDDEARARLLECVDGKLLTEPMLIPFRTGIRESFWKKNCVSVGLAGGFIEPLEATAIHLVVRGMDFFLRYFPDKSCEPALINEYNRRMRMDYEEIRDFVVLHYCVTEREDTPFWQHCKTMAIPDTLRERIELFKAHGTLREGVDELFRSPSWQSVFEGMGIRPANYSPRIDNLDYKLIEDTLAEARKSIAAMVETLPSHDQFIRQKYLAL
ncbi:tryptophan 7-halogenase [Seongchinamella unica]|uniref:Tryptophan 7-halogenase n=1 Tax=Seongchinamella unica TaxID=2547392 RepID=A0A4R5LUT5_9GAMM|nr:tryptophan halogenase family protein [Seongchinamella unica]TDG15196.1 tryptophan 7-halogenase [Seongchinamella unica]